MAIQRNARQRKKMHLAEFQELGFLVKFNFAEGTGIDQIDATVDRFIDEVIKANCLAYEVCLEKIGKCDESHRQLVKTWLENNGLQNVQVSELFDIWWDFPAEA